MALLADDIRGGVAELGGGMTSDDDLVLIESTCAKAKLGAMATSRAPRRNATAKLRTLVIYTVVSYTTIPSLRYMLTEV